MGSWYWIGVLAGLGAAIGLFGAGVVPRRIVALPAAALAALIGVAAFGWDEGVAGLLGAACGGLGGLPVVAGSLRRGGTRGGVATLVSLAALGLAAVAFVPAAGYLEAVVLPALALRLHRREPERHAGLRTLARD